MNRPLFQTTLSIPSYDIGKWFGLRTYQNPIVGGVETQLFSALISTQDGDE
jgi:hypothetical protein